MNQELIDLICDGAVLVRQGAFTLAVEKAQEKLKKFQLPDPRYYITQVLQALLASGAKRIQVKTENLTVKISFDGPGYTQEELQNIADAVFESGKNRDRDRLRELALGLLSAQGLGPRDISIASNGYRWEKRKVSPAPNAFQEILIHHRRNDTQEARILRETCQSCRADVLIDEALICTLHSNRVTGCPWPNFPFKGKGFRGAFGIAYGDIAATSLCLTRYGVVFSRRHETRIQPPLIVEMEHDLLRKNASQSDVVEDENYSAMLADLQKVQLEFAVQLSTQRIPTYQSRQVYTYLLEMVAQNISRELLGLSPEVLGKLENDLLNAPLLPTADGRRCSPRQVFQCIEENGVVLYCEDNKLNIRCQPGTVLRLSEPDAQSLKPLFPELAKLVHLTTEECENKLRAARQARANQLPPFLAESDYGRFKVALLDRPPDGKLHFFLKKDGELSHQVLGDSPLSFALIGEQPVKWCDASHPVALPKVVEPLYVHLIRSLARATPQSRPARQRAIFHYLEYKYKTLSAALKVEEWRTRSLFWTAQHDLVSLADIEAWLSVYPFLVGTFGGSIGLEDHSLQLTPAVADVLREMLGSEKIQLADLANPRLIERGQQMGLKGAATAGVQARTVVDEDEELAAIRRELSQAEAGPGLVAKEEIPLDAEAVMAQLRLQLPATNLAEAEERPEFCRHCQAAVRGLQSRWVVGFQQPGLEGQVLVQDGPLPRPLQPEHLVVKVADNDPVAYSTSFLGFCGWLYIPPGWQSDPNYVFTVVPPGLELGELSQSWPSPGLPFDLGLPSVHVDLIWRLRSLFKLAAQHYSQTNRVQALQALWSRRLAQFLLWDEAWALSSEESWFFRIPLWRNLAGRLLDLKTLRRLGPWEWAPLGSGLPAEPATCLRLLPPFQLEDLTRLIGQPLQRAQLHIEERREEQLLAELKQWLVQTCQMAQAPLEAAWVENLKFGQPTRWIGGPRKYFIEHQAEEALTRLNPADPLFRRLFREPDDWGERIPVLASAVYTAINRALSEVKDEHELAYLEAMLNQL